MNKALYFHSPSTSLDEPISDHRGSNTDERHSFMRRYACDISAKWNNWLTDVTFDWHHVMETAVERNYQNMSVFNFVFRLFYKTYLKASQRMSKNDVNTKCKYKRWLSFFWHSSKYERNGFHAKLTSFAWDLIAFILWWILEKWNLFLK